MVTDDQVVALRAFLAGDFAEHDRLTQHLDETDGWDGYPALLGAAFLEAVDRRFATGYTRADVIQLVTDARGRFDESGEVLDPTAAERLVLAVLGEGSVDDLNDKIRARTQVLLLGELITKENLEDAVLDEFMESARDLANQSLS